MTISYIGLGSNLAKPQAQIQAALNAIKALKQASNVVISALYTSTPMGPQDQPDYINAMVKLNWQGEAITLLDALQTIELAQGRVRKEQRWGARTLDLDIILFGNHIIETDRLTVPHYGMKTREFVLHPLAELTPNLTLPCGVKLIDLLPSVPLNGLRKINSTSLN